MIIIKQFNYYITLKDVLIERILSEIHQTGKTIKLLSYNGISANIYVTNFKECTIYEINNIKIFKVPYLSSFIKYEDLIDITDDCSFSFANILNGNVKDGNVILEGADGTGKSTISKAIAIEDKVLCQDRNVNGITRSVSSLDLTFSEKVTNIYNFLASNQNKDILFFVLLDNIQLRNRILNRDRISEWDLRAEQIQQEYLNIYNELKDFKNLYLYDVANKSIDEVKDIVRTHIKDRINR